MQYEEKSWDEFRASGVFGVINSILHLFGWVLVAEASGPEATDKTIRVFPARTNGYGFTADAQDRMYKKFVTHIGDSLPLMRRNAGLED